MSSYKITDGWCESAERRNSSFYNERPQGNQGKISLLVIHNISLPAGQFGTPYVDDLFMGCLDCQAHDSFHDLQGLEVSSHFFITRKGILKQYVSVLDRAWHAGLSSFKGKANCNDFSVGVELEGTDNQNYTDQQYHTLIGLSKSLVETFFHQ